MSTEQFIATAAAWGALTREQQQQLREEVVLADTFPAWRVICANTDCQAFAGPERYRFMDKIDNSYTYRQFCAVHGATYAALVAPAALTEEA